MEPIDPPARTALFESPTAVGRELVADEIPRLQALFEANPEYFLRINSRLPHPDEAEREFHDLPPPHLSYNRQWVIGLFDRADTLIGITMVVSDLIVSGTWHIGLFLVATPLHGSGVAAAAYAALERWATENGALWMRLNVVVGNVHAERFWAKCGFCQLRVRKGLDTGGRVNDLLVLLKPLGSAGLADYLELAPRDRPDSTLP